MIFCTFDTRNNKTREARLRNSAAHSRLRTLRKKENKGRNKARAEKHRPRKKRRWRRRRRRKSWKRNIRTSGGKGRRRSRRRGKRRRRRRRRATCGKSPRCETEKRVRSIVNSHVRRCVAGIHPRESHAYRFYIVFFSVATQCRQWTWSFRRSFQSIQLVPRFLVWMSSNLLSMYVFNEEARFPSSKNKKVSWLFENRYTLYLITNYKIYYLIFSKLVCEYISDMIKIWLDRIIIRIY